MKQFSLHLLNALFTRNHYRRSNALRLSVLAAILCGISNVSLGQIAITLSAPSPVAAADVCRGATNVSVFSFRIAGSGTGATNVVTAISFNQTGSASFPTDIVQYTLWRDAIGGSGVNLGTTVGSTFSGLNEAFNASTTTNYFITADVTTGATTGNTIIGGAMTSANITSASGAGTVSGSAAAQGAQTIRALPTVASLTTGATPICGGQTLQLTAGAVTGTGTLSSYNWAGPSAPVVSTATSPYNYTTATLNGGGSYSVTVTYPGTGCTSLPAVSSSVVINDQPNNPTGAYLCTNIPMTNFAATDLNRNGITGAVWSSNNSAVATVDATGKVYPTFSAAGQTVTITAVKGGCSAITVGTVSPRPSRIVSSTGIPTMIIQLCGGATLQLSSATLGGTWSSDNNTIATVTNGVPTNTTTVTGGALEPASGSTTIHYKIASTGCDTVVFFDVNPRPFPINGPSGPGSHPNEVCQGFSINLTSISTGAAWTSSNSGIASVVAGPFPGTTGTVTGQSTGVANITYAFTATGCFRTYSVTVQPVPLPITGDTVTCTGLSIQVSDISPGGVWSTNVPSVATVGGSGPVTVYGSPSTSGFTNLLYTYPSTGCSAIRLIRVNQQPGPIAGPNQVCAGNYIQLTNAVGGGTWSSSQTTVATIDLTSGLLYGQYATPLPQVAQVDYNLQGCLTVSKNILVNLAPGPINGVQNMCIGSYTTLSDTTAGGVWSLNNPAVTTFSPSAPSLVGLSLGFAVVTYTLPASGCYDTAIVIVYPNPDPIVGSDTVCQGATITLSNTTGGGTWSSTLLSVAQIIDTSGVLTGIGAGDAVISYNLPTGCFDTARIHVNPPVVATVDIIRDPGGITCQGGRDTFKAVQTNGGRPEYQWIKFNAPIPGATNSSYLPSSQINGDLIVVKMTPRGSCATNSVVYDSIVAVVYPIANTQIRIASSPLDTFADYLGEVYTFTTETTFGGGSTVYQWYLNGIAIPGATGATYTTPVYASGYYHCVMTGFSPCNINAIGTSDSIHIIQNFHPAGVPTTAVSGNLSLFPNPSNGNITVRGTLDGYMNTELDVEINDVLGHVVYKGKAASQNGIVEQQIDLGNSMPEGTYLLRVSAEGYNQVFRFVISR